MTTLPNGDYLFIDPLPQRVEQDWLDWLNRQTAREDSELVLPWLAEEDVD